MHNLKKFVTPVVISIYEDNEDREDPIRQSTANFKDAAGKDFINKTMTWALTNGHEVVIRPLDDGEEVDEIDNRS